MALRLRESPLPPRTTAVSPLHSENWLALGSGSVFPWKSSSELASLSDSKSPLLSASCSARKKVLP
jgi:hypothetical protein